MLFNLALKYPKMDTSIIASLFNKFEQILFLTVMAVVLLIGSACGGDDEVPLTGTKYSISDITGSWTATSALIFNLTAGVQPATVDVVGEGGSLMLSVQSNGRFILTIKRPSRADGISAGDMGFDDEWLAVSFDDAPGDYSYMFIEMDENRNNMTIRGETEYDFDVDGTEELASIDLEMTRI